MDVVDCGIRGSEMQFVDIEHLSAPTQYSNLLAALNELPEVIKRFHLTELIVQLYLCPP